MSSNATIICTLPRHGLSAAVVHNKLIGTWCSGYLFCTRRNVPLIRKLSLWLKTLIFNVLAVYILPHIILRDAKTT